LSRDLVVGYEAADPELNKRRIQRFVKLGGGFGGDLPAGIERELE
jgi:hypothetical protein